MGYLGPTRSNITGYVRCSTGTTEELNRYSAEYPKGYSAEYGATVNVA